jgi:diguanylate cyclase (GGDEF)-like protein
VSGSKQNESGVDGLVALVHELRQALAAEVEERRRLDAEVRRLSLTDELTGVANRRGFLILAEQARNVVRRSRDASLLLFVDLDGLRLVNDVLGLDHGDELIRDTAAVLADAFRGCDVVGRWGGDEFVAFLPGSADAGPVRHRLEERIERCNRHRTGEPLRVSVGTVTVAATDSRPLVQLLAEADSAMYAEKRQRALASAR